MTLEEEILELNKEVEKFLKRRKPKTSREISLLLEKLKDPKYIKAMMKQTEKK